MKISYKNTTVKIAPNVYEPSEDSFMLADAALSEIRESETVLEVGCGSGIIARVIKEHSKASVIGIDINPHAVKTTKENGVEVIRGDLLHCLKGKLDIIIFNPPYLPTGEDERTKDWMNTALDGGYDGRRVIYSFLENAGDRLVEKGRILMVLSSLTGIEQVKEMMESLGYTVTNKAVERFSFEQLTVILAAKI